MNIIKYFALLSFINNGFSQNVIVEYTSKINANNAISSSETSYQLILNDSVSSYSNTTKDESQFIHSENAFDKKQIDDVVQVKLSDNHYVYIKDDYFYKNYTQDSLIYNETISTKKMVVGEKINLLDWEISPKSDTLILGYKCQKAVTKFRGRNYEAYFSNELAPYGGPWKFDGLPGLILSVKSLDNYFIIEPQKIVQNSKTAPEVKNIYNKDSILSWNEYKKLFKQNMERLLKKLKSLSEDGEGGSIKITDRIEDMEISEMKF